MYDSKAVKLLIALLVLMIGTLILITISSGLEIYLNNNTKLEESISKIENTIETEKDTMINYKINEQDVKIEEKLQR